MRSLASLFLLAAFLALPFATPAQAQVSATYNGWTFTVSGSAGGFASYTACDSAPKVGDFYVACAGGPNAKNSTSFSSGLVPGHATFEVKSQAAGWDFGGALGWWSNAAASGSGSNVAFGSTNTDQRQNYVFFGKKDLGTFKVGRDFGVFGGEALGADMTVAGVGSAGYHGPHGNSTAGRIGVGYFFLDETAQITYSSPKVSGFQVVVSVEQAWDLIDKSFKPVVAVHQTPAFDGKITFDIAGAVPVHTWVSGWVQNAETGGAASTSITSVAVDAGVSLTPIPDLTLVATGYYGSGAGMFARGFYALADNLSTRDSAGGYGQVTYRIADVKLGASYGLSSLSLASNEVNPTLIKTNASIIGGLYYGLTPNVTLTAEYAHTMTKDQAGDKASDNNIALGSIIFF